MEEDNNLAFFGQSAGVFDHISHVPDSDSGLFLDTQRGHKKLLEYRTLLDASGVSLS